jgi:hypothetical protein
MASLSRSPFRARHTAGSSILGGVAKLPHPPPAENGCAAG